MECKFVIVEDIEEIVTEEGFGDKTVYVWNEETYYSLDEVETGLKDNGFSKNAIEAFCDDLEYYGQCNNKEIQKHEIIIRYRPIAYFLTRAEADRYVKYQSHNLTKPRVYTRSCGYGNNGDLQCLYQLLLRIGRQLNQNDAI